MKSIYREIIVKLSYPSRKSFALQRLRRFFTENVVYPSFCGDGNPYPRKNADFKFSSCRRALPPSDVHSSVCTKTQCLHQGEQMMSFAIFTGPMNFRNHYSCRGTRYRILQVRGNSIRIGLKVNCTSRQNAVLQRF